MKATITALALAALLTMPAKADGNKPDTLYHEPYRPQYHFSPKRGWIGDPSGLILYQGKYQGFWWGKTVSADLVHWQETSPRVMRHDDRNISFFTGSVAIDRNNTAGFGPGAYIAAYTSYENDSKKQAQSISYSLNGGNTFHWYDNNPVIDLWSSEFRDPTVFWHPQSGRWVMVVAKALEKKVKFYTSTDLKTWTWQSDFGPAGNSERSWECPDLFPLAVDGNPDNTLWVLLVSINWAQEQYFIGHFDGTKFTPIDGHPATPLYVDQGLDYYASRTFRNYDVPAGTPQATVPTVGWVATWDYAQKVPSTYGKGFWSVARDLALKTFPEGIRLTQQPVDALKKLRYGHQHITQEMPLGARPMPKFQPGANTYELIARFSTSTPTTLGLNLCCGNGRALKISYDTRSHYLIVDRTHCAAEHIDGFDRVAKARVTPVDGKLTLHIFVDKASVEIFTGTGKETFTLQTFPADGQCGIELFALNKGVRADIDAYMLHSIWP